MYSKYCCSVIVKRVTSLPKSQKIEWAILFQEKTVIGPEFSYIEIKSKGWFISLIEIYIFKGLLAKNVHPTFIKDHSTYRNKSY